MSEDIPIVESDEMYAYVSRIECVWPPAEQVATMVKGGVILVEPHQVIVTIETEGPNAHPIVEEDDGVLVIVEYNKGDLLHGDPEIVSMREIPLPVPVSAFEEPEFAKRPGEIQVVIPRRAWAERKVVSYD